MPIPFSPISSHAYSVRPHFGRAVRDDEYAVIRKTLPKHLPGEIVYREQCAVPVDRISKPEVAFALLGGMGFNTGVLSALSQDVYQFAIVSAGTMLIQSSWYVGKWVRMAMDQSLDFIRASHHVPSLDEPKVVMYQLLTMDDPQGFIKWLKKHGSKAGNVEIQAFPVENSHQLVAKVVHNLDK